MKENITQTEYDAFQAAYDFFNVELFGKSLPQLLITLRSKSKSYGYFAPEIFTARNGEEKAHELALNPDHFGRSDEDILSTLVHEMCHVWQQTHGTPPRKAYHDRQWAAKMVEIGLQPSHTGAPGGKTTGQKMTHYVLALGAFAKAFAKLQAKGFALRWQSVQIAPDREKKSASKTKFTCPNCEANAWAKPDSKLICGTCFEEEEEIFNMEAEI